VSELSAPAPDVTSEVWVCFCDPQRPLPEGAVALSFLAAADEQQLEATYGDRLLRGRQEMESVRDAARAAYVALTARLASEPVLARRKTLRGALGGRGASRWWYHPVAARDSTAVHDSTYLNVLRLFCVLRVCERSGSESVRLFGAPREIAAALRPRFNVQHESSERRAAPVAGALAAALAGRGGYLLFCWAIRLLVPTSHIRFDVGLQAHWNVTLLDSIAEPRDKMFVDLPAELRHGGVRQAWLCWYDGDGVAASVRGVLRLRTAASRRPEIVALQALVPMRRSFAEAVDIRPLITIARALRRDSFRALFRCRGLDLLPLLSRRLLLGAAGSAIPRGAIAEAGTEHAAARHRLKIALTCHELFVHAKAIYAGWRAGAPGRPAWSVQHAAYSPDKTFGLLDPERDLRGAPDGLAAPAPDRIFAIGESDRRFFEASGFPPERIEVSGGLRYARVRAAPEEFPLALRAATAGSTIAGHDPGLTLLILASLGTTDEDLDTTQAVELASRDLPRLRLVLRNHPYERGPISTRAEFAPLAERITVSAKTLEQDLDHAALVVTACSSMASEALVRGIPTCQWLCAAPDQTPFLALPVVPRLGSIRALRETLERFVADPTSFVPEPQLRRLVLAECFGPADGLTARRVASAVSAVCGNG
jgi:hypothetical protein